jgi:hypothetical protein
MTFAAGDLGGGVKAPGSGDAGTAGHAQAGRTSQGLFSPGREPNSRSGAVTTSTLAIQVAAQIGGCAPRLIRVLITQRESGAAMGVIKSTVIMLVNPHGECIRAAWPCVTARVGALYPGRMAGWLRIQ